MESKFNAYCSMKQDPVYAEVGGWIQTKLNHAYASTQHVGKQKASHSSIPPQPIADQVCVRLQKSLTGVYIPSP